MSLVGKKILVGITGGIAAYKIPALIRLLKKSGAEAKVIMTDSAKNFVTPLTLSTVSENAVDSVFFEPTSGVWTNHVELGLWADLMVIAPATANTIGKAANGIADNLLITTYLSARCPVWWFPAMDLDMYKHHGVLRSLELLRSYGNRVIEPEDGSLASGLSGKGRLPEPETIHALIEEHFSTKDAFWQGKQVLINAGPTFEPIDPVRFIGNRSSGKMGIALAEQAALLGANVTLVLGPTHLSPSSEKIKLLRVETALEMAGVMEEFFSESDVTILSAAVADYAPQETATQKIKSKTSELSIQLKKTIDIAALLGSKKKENQILVGFALETEKEIEHALGKLEKKNLDLIVLNSLNDKGAGFSVDTNKITIIAKGSEPKVSALLHKEEIAKIILQAIKDQVS